MRIDISLLICKSSTIIRDALVQLNKNAKRILFIINEEGHFLDTLTDGDLRRAMLVDCDQSKPVLDLIDESSELYKRILNNIDDETYKNRLTRPVVSAEYGASFQDLKKLISERIKIVPLLQNGKIVDYYEDGENKNVPIASPNLSGNEARYVMECLESNWVSSQGKFVNELEKNFSSYCDAKYGVAVSNGTSALHLALLALGIEEGDEVIVPDLTFAATLNAVIYAHATPVIVDVDENSWCIDPKSIEDAITKKTRAIIPVHLYGQSADMKAIMDIARRYNLYIIEDTAEALGAKFNGKKCGSFGNIGCFSMFGNKIITSGEGGVCVTSNKKLYDKMCVIRDHGMSMDRKYWHETVGYNFRLTNLQAALAVAQLEQIESFLGRRDRIKEIYNEHLKNNDLVPQKSIEGVRSVTWLVCFLLSGKHDRKRFIEITKLRGIDIRPFFYPLSDMPPFKKYCRKYTPVTHELSKKGICLPTIIDLSDEKYVHISKIIIEGLKEI